jgi:hypothetical protein
LINLPLFSNRRSLGTFYWKLITDWLSFSAVLYEPIIGPVYNHWLAIQYRHFVCIFAAIQWDCLWNTNYKLTLQSIILLLLFCTSSNSQTYLWRTKHRLTVLFGISQSMVIRWKITRISVILHLAILKAISVYIIYYNAWHFFVTVVISLGYLYCIN